MISLNALMFLKLIHFYSETHVRLTGHNSTFAGRVEVFSHGVWGRVIDTWSSWRRKEAIVVCGQLGFPGAITALSYSAFGEGLGPVVMSRVQCLGTERTLQQCSYQDFANSNLNAGYEVGVICKTFQFQRDGNGSTLPYTGRVEVFYAGVWGAISRSNWDINGANVVCRQLGYSAGAEAALRNDVYGLVSGPVWITNLQCTGSESNVMECVHDGLGNKTELQYRHKPASVICRDSSFSNAMQVRLRGSHSSNMGRVEVHYAGKWGSVYASGWDIKDATVACRQLGYHSATLAGYNLFCSADIPVWFTNFRCNGTETSLEECAWDFYYWSSTYCANVVCTGKITDKGPKLRLKGSPLPHAGRVELRFQGIWGTIYSSHYFFDGGLRPRAARVICRQLGFADSVISAGYSVYGPGVGPQWLRSYDLNGCLGNESNILNCSYSPPYFRSYYRRSDSSVVCKPNARLTNDFQVRLNGSSLSFAGTINVLYYGLWGGILGIRADILLGHVVCRQLGYSGAERIFRYAVYGEVTGPLWIWNIKCNGNETKISQCTVETLEKIWRRHWHYSYYQRPVFAAGLLCKKANSSFSKVINVRLAGAPISNAGRVEVLYAGVWGTISGSQWDINDAHVVCRQLGYPGAITSGNSNQFGLGTGPTWFEDVRCLGNESSFEECSKRTLSYPNGFYSRVATLLCKLKRISVLSRNCSTMKCSGKGTCINTPFSPICNCTKGFTGLNCEIRTLNQCKTFPCQNGGQCFSDGSLYLCVCPQGLTGKHCNEKIVPASNPCQSNPCQNDTSCYHNDNHFACIPYAEKNSHTGKNAEHSNTHFIVGLSVSVLLVLVFAAVIGCLVFKIRQMRKNQPNHPGAVFSNMAYPADSERKLDDIPTNDVDLGMVAIRGGTNSKSSIYENPSRPLPQVPQRNNTRSGVPSSAARQTNGGYSSGTKTRQAERLYMGLTTTNGNNTKPLAAEPSSYMSLTPERPETGSYSALTAARPQVPRKAQRGIGKRKRPQRDSETYANMQG